MEILSQWKWHLQNDRFVENEQKVLIETQQQKNETNLDAQVFYSIINKYKKQKKIAIKMFWIVLKEKVFNNLTTCIAINRYFFFYPTIIQRKKSIWHVKQFERKSK